MGSVLDKKIRNAGGSTVRGGDLDLLKQTARWFNLKKAKHQDRPEDGSSRLKVNA